MRNSPWVWDLVKIQYPDLWNFLGELPLIPTDQILDLNVLIQLSDLLVLHQIWAFWYRVSSSRLFIPSFFFQTFQQCLSVFCILTCLRMPSELVQSSLVLKHQTNFSSKRILSVISVVMFCILFFLTLFTLDQTILSKSYYTFSPFLTSSKSWIIQEW